VLQRQIDLFDEYKSRALRDIVSAANAGATTRPLASTNMVLHHRSASDDADQHQQLISDDLKYTYHTPPWSGSSRSSRGHQRPSAAVFRRDTMPPIHLMSATNEVRSGLVQPQQLPLKLASSSDSAARRPRWTSGSPAAISSSRSPSEQLPDPQPVDEDPRHVDRTTPDQQLSVGLAGRCEGDVTGYSDQCTTKRAAAVSPTSTVLRHNTTSTTTKHPSQATSPSALSVIQQNVATSSMMSRSSPSASSMLPMKLAERPRPKSATSPTAQTTSTSTSTSTRTKSKTSGSSVLSSVQSRTLPVDEEQTRRTPRMDSSYSTQNSTHSTVSNPTPTQRNRQIIYF